MTEIKFPVQFRGLKERHRYKVFYGGRGSGKSWSIARFLLALSISRRITILCCREIQNSLADSVYQLLIEQIQLLNISSYFNITKSEITTSIGSRFIFKGLYRNIRSIKSIEGIDIAWVEEAEGISQESLDFLIPTVRKEGSEIWFTFNPDQKDDPVYNNFVTTEREDVYKAKVNFTENINFPEVLKKEMDWDREHDPEKYSWIWEGNCREHTEAQVFRGRYSIKTFDVPSDVEFMIGADWGFSQDPTTVVRCYADENILYIDKESYGVGVSLDDTPKLFDLVLPSKKWPVTADSARPETIDFMNIRGYNIDGAKKGKGSVEDGIERLKQFDKIVIHPRCKHTIDEFKMYSYKTNKLNGQILPVLEDKHNHIIDSLRYATETYVSGVASIGRY